MSDSKIDQPTEVEMREIVAFLLSNADAEIWRRDAELRQTIRQNAQQLVKQLADRGIDVRVMSARKLRAAVDDLITIPATRAYDL
jgi:phosphoserine phosphatase